MKQHQIRQPQAQWAITIPQPTEAQEIEITLSDQVGRDKPVASGPSNSRAHDQFEPDTKLSPMMSLEDYQPFYSYWMDFNQMDQTFLSDFIDMKFNSSQQTYFENGVEIYQDEKGHASPKA